MDDYELIGVDFGRRVERFGQQIVNRPAPGRPSYDRRMPRGWSDADLTFDRERGWRGPGLLEARRTWTVRICDLTFELRPTDTGQVGLFPEHAAMIPWLEARIARLDHPRVLNLFAYTGMTTLALARAGASVAHVDAARSSLAWARRNAALNALDDRPIRWLFDDARKFVARESRRDRRFDGVVLDPPTYGHGRGGRAWQLERDLGPLLADVRRVLAPRGFVLLTAHAEAIDPETLGSYLLGDSGQDEIGAIEIGELALDATSGATLRLGAFARLDGGA